MAATGVTMRAIHRIRQANLKRVIKSQFEDNASEAARAIKRSHTYMWQLVKGVRTIGENSARHIERMLKLTENALDANGDTTSATLKLVPVLALDNVDAKASNVMTPCPDPALEKAFAVEVTEAIHDDVAQLEVGDRVFVERGAAMVARKLYVVVPKREKRALILMSREGGAFVATSTRSVSYQGAEVRVIGRVMLVVRSLK